MTGTDNIVFMIIVGSLAVFGLVAFIIFLVLAYYKRYIQQQQCIREMEMQKEKEIRDAIIRTQEEERMRIAASLHDGVGAELSMLKLNLSKHAFFLKNIYRDVDEMHTEILNLDKTVESLRDTCRDLYPVTLKNHGLIPTLQDLLQKTARAAGLRYEFRNKITKTKMKGSMEKDLNLFRISQELLHNITKHSGCRNLEMNVSQTNEHFRIDFVHDGEGLTNDRIPLLILQNKGIGLKSINNRIRLVNGSIDYFRSENKSQIQIKIPSNESQN